MKTNRFRQRPLAIALAATLALGGAKVYAAEVEIRTPAGGGFAVRDSTGSLSRLLVNGATGEVAIPYLQFATQQNNVVCFQLASGLLGQCVPGSLTGPQGPQGVQGSAGPQGSQGAIGLQGPQGTNGAQGSQGMIGAQGSQGTAGSLGPQGTTGAQGPIGPQGTIGAQGARGTDGFTVLSGTGAPDGGLGVNGDFYIDTTNEVIYGPKTGGVWGTPTSLIGPQGPAGPPGSQGIAGAQGTTGALGPQGTQGTTGALGPQGAQGTTGALGPQGTQGTTGALGPQGTQGSQGTTGSPGSGGGIVNFQNISQDVTSGQCLNYRTGNDSVAGACVSGAAAWFTDQLRSMGPVPASILSNLYAIAQSGPVSGQSWTVDVLANGTAAFSCTVGAGATTCQNSGTAAVAAGSYLQVRVTGIGAPSSTRWRVVFGM